MQGQGIRREEERFVEERFVEERSGITARRRVEEDEYKREQGLIGR